MRLCLSSPFLVNITGKPVSTLVFCAFVSLILQISYLINFSSFIITYCLLHYLCHPHLYLIRWVQVCSNQCDEIRSLLKLLPWTWHEAPSWVVVHSNLVPVFSIIVRFFHLLSFLNSIHHSSAHLPQFKACLYWIWQVSASICFYLNSNRLFSSCLLLSTTVTVKTLRRGSELRETLEQNVGGVRECRRRVGKLERYHAGVKTWLQL